MVSTDLSYLKKLAQGWEIVFRYIDGKVKSFTLKPGPKLAEQVTKVKEVLRRSLIDGDTLSWKAFIDDISKNGTVIRISLGHDAAHEPTEKRCRARRNEKILSGRVSLHVCGEGLLQKDHTTQL